MTRIEADIEILKIHEMSLPACQSKYNVDTKEEIITLIEEDVDETEDSISYDIYNENGFLSAYHCNSFLF